MTSNPDSGIVTVPGNHSVDQTVEKLKATLLAKGVKLFVTIDHSGEAEQAACTCAPPSC